MVRAVSKEPDHPCIQGLKLDGDLLVIQAIIWLNFGHLKIINFPFGTN